MSGSAAMETTWPLVRLALWRFVEALSGPLSVFLSPSFSLLLAVAHILWSSPLRQFMLCHVFVWWLPSRVICSAGSMDGTARVYNVHSGKLLCTLEGPSEELEWIEFGPDNGASTVLAAGSRDKTVWVWNVPRYRASSRGLSLLAACYCYCCCWCVCSLSHRTLVMCSGKLMRCFSGHLAPVISGVWSGEQAPSLAASSGRR